MQVKSHQNKFKVGIVGGINVGKTCLEGRFLENRFPTRRYGGTLDTDLFSRRNIMINKKQATLMIKNILALCLSYLDYFYNYISQKWKLQGLLLCYAVDDRESLNKIKEFLDHSQDRLRDICMVLVATKCDVNNICIEYEEGKKLADKYGLKLFETSAKEDSFVEEVFYEILNQMVEKHGQFSEPENQDSLVPKEKNINTTCGCF